MRTPPVPKIERNLFTKYNVFGLPEKAYIHLAVHPYHTYIIRKHLQKICKTCTMKKQRKALEKHKLTTNVLIPNNRHHANVTEVQF